MQQQHSRLRLIAALVVGIVSAASLLAPTPARASSGACDASLNDYCCTCWLSGQSYECYRYAFSGVWSCTTEFCSTTPCSQ